MFSAPTAMRMLRKFPADWFEKHDLSALRYIFLAGEPLDEPTWRWAKDALKKPVIDHYWQTNRVGPCSPTCLGSRCCLSNRARPPRPCMAGTSLSSNENGDEVPFGTRGLLVARPPLPAGTFLTAMGWTTSGNVQTYWKHFQGKPLFYTGDYAIRTRRYFWVLGRADEVINIAGHRLGTRESRKSSPGTRAVAEGQRGRRG